MELWEIAALTEKGLELQTKLMNGQTLQITKVVAGGQKAEIADVKYQKEVLNPKQILTLQSINEKENLLEMSVVLENTRVEESYELCQIGFYAKDPDEGEILYCIAQASHEKMIPTKDESPGYCATWKFFFKNSNDVLMNFQVDPAGLVSMETLEEKALELKQSGEEKDAQVTLEMRKELQETKELLAKEISKYLPLNGGRIGGNLYLDQGFNVISSGEGAGKTGYMHIAEISVRGSYVNSPITLELVRRGDLFPTNIAIQFSNTESTDPGIAGFWYQNPNKMMDIFLHKAGSSRWNLYVGKSEAYDNIAVLNIKKNFSNMSAVPVKFIGIYVSSVPAGAMKAVNWEDSGWIDCTMGNGISPYSLAINKPQVRKMGKIVHLRGCVTNSNSWTEHTSIITIPSGYRPPYNENIVQQGSSSNRYLLTVTTGGGCSAQRYSNNTTMSNTVPAGSWLNMYATWFVN